MDPLQKSETLKWTLHKIRRPYNRTLHKNRDLKTDPKVKNYHVIFFTLSAQMSLLESYIFPQKIKNFFTKLQIRFTKMGP